MGEPLLTVLPLDAFDADYTWNKRGKERALSRAPHADAYGDDEALGLEGFAAVLEREGQNQPGDLRTLPDGKLSLMCGFRRRGALELLYSEGRVALGLEPGMMRVRLHGHVSEFDALCMNIGENIHRENLTPPELIAGLRAIMTEKPDLTPEELAARFGRSLKFAKAVFVLHNRLSPKVWDLWRNSPTRPMAAGQLASVAKAPADEQLRIYNELLVARPPPKVPLDGSRWLVRTTKKARKAGAYLGALEREGIIRVSPGINWLASVRHIFAFKKTINGQRLTLTTEGAVAKALADGYVMESLKPRGQPALPEPMDEDNDDD